MTAVASLGSESGKLDKETWRFHSTTCHGSSICHELIAQLHLDQTDTTDRSLYNVWSRVRHQIRRLIKNEIAAISRSEFIRDNGDNDQAELGHKKKCPFHSNLSSTISQRSKRYVNIDESGNEKTINNNVVTKFSIAFTYRKWNEVFSCVGHRMNLKCSNIFVKKIELHDCYCPL